MKTIAVRLSQAMIGVGIAAVALYGPVGYWWSVGAGFFGMLLSVAVEWTVADR